MNMATAVNMPLRLRTILAHLGKRPSITPLEAFGLYGEQRLADVVYELKARGYRINTEMRKDVKGRKYAHYTMAPAVTKELVAA